MDTALFVMIILCIVYVPIWFWVWRCPEKAAKYHLVKYGPTVMIKTTLGIKTMDKLGKYKTLWRVFGFISKFISALLFFMMMYMLIVSIISLPGRIGSGGIGIQYALAIPGFNPMLPLTYGIVALFFAMVVHEMGHGIQSRANDVSVDSTGLLYGVVPLGAFCEPNEKELAEKPQRAKMDVYSAGISVNTIFALISFGLMFLLLSAVSIADFGQSADMDDLPGVYSIDEDSPADDAGIPTSALILAIRDSEETKFYDVEVVRNDRAIAFDSDIDLDPLRSYYIRYAVSDDEVVESDTSIQLGALIKNVTNNSPAKKADLEPLTFLYSMTITRDGVELPEEKFGNSYDFIEFMSSTLPGDLAVVKTVTMASTGSIDLITHDQVTLTSSGSQGYLGIVVTNSGMTLTTPSIMLESAKDPFMNASSPVEYVQAFLSYLSGPLNGLDPVPNKITWWYEIPGGDNAWIIVKMLYWIFWLDILLAISNALPAYPFDGGFLFEGGINWLLRKLGIKDEERRKKLSENFSGAVSNVVLIMFFLVLLAFII